jgi:DNA invertase Pin-like site-specific DNA recombinase
MTFDVQRITADHLKRDAYLYVRQSTLRQVVENVESGQRQYSLKQRAIAFGWPPERVVVIDSDQGQSGADSDRAGFQQLVREVGLGRAGIVLGLEVSRLARNSSDWHRLLEICALTHTLILDEDGLYDPMHFNDRLLLGLKGTMSEAELHVLRARLTGGLRNKARRGELRVPLPMGLTYDELGRTTLDPDQQIRQAVANLFSTYARTGSATATVRHFQREAWLFPTRIRRGPRKGAVLWEPLAHSRALQVLHNPRYAGAYVFGRNRVYKTSAGKSALRALPQNEWQVLLPNSFPGYITWEQFQENQRHLKDLAAARGNDRRQGPPGRGTALLQGLAICGACGQRMTVRYHQRRSGIVPDYLCQREGIEYAEPICQQLSGGSVDDAIGALVVERLTPAAIDLAIAVEEELQSRWREADALRRQQVERSRYEAELAQRRYLQVDPANRLVAATLEAEWNAKLRELQEATASYEEQSRQQRLRVEEQARAEIQALVTDFPRLWKDDRTSDQDRKRMLRLLIEDVTLSRRDGVLVQVRFKGGACHTLTLPRPLHAGEMRQTDPEVVWRIDELLDTLTPNQAAQVLNREGFKSGTDLLFTGKMVRWIRRTYRLKPRQARLRESGLKTIEEIADELGVARVTVREWRKHGLLQAYAADDKGTWLFEPLGEDRPVKQQGQKLADRRQFPPLPSQESNEVHDAT